MPPHASSRSFPPGRASALAATALLMWGCAQHLDAGELERAASAWRPGEAVPAELLSYRPRQACLHLPTDSAVIVGQINNLPLLMAIATDESAADELVELALERALLVAGPGRVFGDLGRMLTARRELSRHPVLADYSERARSPHVWLSAIYVRTSELPEAEARALLAPLASRLERGESLDAVYREVFDQHQSASPDGTPRPLLGNLGDFVVSAEKRDAAPYRHAELAPDNVAELLATRSGGVQLLLDDCDDCRSGGRERAPARVVLYQVRERYVPGA